MVRLKELYMINIHDREQDKVVGWIVTAGEDP